MYIVLMAGGIGTRFWPRSRANMPKQLLNIFGNKSMLRMTYERIKKLTSDDKIIIITSMELSQQVKEHIPELPEANIIAEPFGRNTAPCIGLASAIINKRANKNEVMVVLPADHLIENDEDFRDTVGIAADYVRENNCLMTIGIAPAYPETGYGYIQQAEKIQTIHNKNIFKVKTFAEKPNLETAQRFIASGDFFWNSGMFIWNVGTIMHSFDEYQHDLMHGISEIEKYLDTPRMNEAIYDLYSKIKSISIDYGIMEYAKDVHVIQADFKWNDIGSWEAVFNIAQKDQNKNAVTAKDYISINSKNNYLFSEKKMVAAIGIKDIVLVDTDDAILICKKDQSQMVKELVEEIKKTDLKNYL